MKKKKKKFELSREWRERHERTQRMLLERLEYHRRRREEQARKQPG
jgi:hypothetical protein